MADSISPSPTFFLPCRLAFSNGAECGEAFRGYTGCLADTDERIEKCRDFEKAFENCIEGFSMKK